MIALSAISILCVAGIAFYVRFLVALCKECKPQFAFYWVRLRDGSEEELEQVPLVATTNTRRVA
jgi:hypothetical protein